MSTNRFPQLAPTIFVTALVASACLTPKRIDEGPVAVMTNGDRVDPPLRAIDAATTQALEASILGRERRDSIAAVALGSCAPAVCSALGRGEVVPGMSHAQLLAATRSTELAWSVRRSGPVAVLSPRDVDATPRDAVAPIALVQFVDGMVTSLTYREPQGLRTVSSVGDARQANAARAAALVSEGDAMAAAGDFTAALERYDRASVVTRADAELQYKMAMALEKLLRPREAELRYRLFLNQLEIDRIAAHGEANAKLAAAMIAARERLVVLERNR